MIANAVTLDDPAIRRQPAVDLDPDSDLGPRLVTVEVGELAEQAVAWRWTTGRSTLRYCCGRG
jgi:hypothetical protein